MTFRCALRFEPDKAKGPGYGLILASCPGFSAAPNTLLYMIKDPSNGMSLGPNGWQPGDAHLVPDAVAPSGEILSLSVGPAVVDSLELQAIYQGGQGPRLALAFRLVFADADAAAANGW